MRGIKFAIKQNFCWVTALFVCWGVLALGSLIYISCFEREGQYIKTDRGYLSFSYGYCHLGLLLNNNHENILDEERKPVSCYGYVTMLPSEAERLNKERL